MATKKAASTTKRKSAVKKPTSVKAVSKASKVTTVKAVSSAKKTVLFSSPLSRAPFLGALIAEFIGTFLLAAAYIAGQGQPIILLFAIAGIVLMVGTLSGAHVNPAVTIGAWVTRRISGMRAIGYLVAQFLGAGVAFAVLKSFVDGAAPVSASAAAYGQNAATLFQSTAIPAGKEWYIFFAELLGAIVIGFAYATMIRYKRDRVAGSLTIGFSIFVGLLLAAATASYVGGSAVVNPAVALALGALKWSVWPLAVYILASVIGATVGFILHDVLRVESDGGQD